MGIKNYLSLIFIVLFVFGCTDNQETTELDFSVKVTGENSRVAFRSTVHPLLRKHCSSCHGDGGTAIRHSVADYIEAHDVVVDGGKVNFSSPASSRLVDKLLSQKHNCWGGDCTSASNEMLAAIEKWIELRGVHSESIGPNVTQNLKYSDAEKRIPETINGTIMLQAEDGELVGRFKTKSSSTASNFTYIAGDLAPKHPIELTDRTGEINSGITGGNRCKVMSDADNSVTKNGRYRIFERKRHYNSQGYRFYNQRVRFRVIRPDKRSEYLAKLEAKQTTLNDLQDFFLTTGAKDDDGIYTGNIVQAGNGGTLRILPEFMSLADYNSKVVGNDPSYKDFFAPRFGDGGIDYFTPTNDEIRVGLPDSVKKDIVYAILKESYRRFYFNADGSLRSISSVPYFLRRGPTTLDGTTAKAQQLLDYYMDLAEGDALSNSGYTDSTIDKLDTYVHYYIDPQDRGFENFSWSHDGRVDNFSINKGNEILDLSALYVDADAIDTRTIMTENYGETLHTILKSNCAGCHGDGSGRPQFASNNQVQAFDAVIGYINFSNASASRPVTRMDEGHNCGTSCQMIKQEMLNAINTWKTKNTDDIEAANSATAPKLSSVSLKDRTPGRVRYKFNVTEAGAYTLWAKVVTSSTGKDSFLVRILDEEGRPRDACNANTSCPFNPDEYKNKTAEQIDSMHCEDWDGLGNKDEWTWYTRSLNNLDERRKWDLEKGIYTLEILEDEIDTKIDLIALSKNPEFNPAENLIDEGVILSAVPRILKYDISKLIGSSGAFEIEIIEKNGGDSYVFRNPRFVDLQGNLKVSDIKLLVNDTYEFANSSFTKLNAVVGPESRVLTNSTLVALSIAGTGSDTFKFAFGELKSTAAGLTKAEDDVPRPVEGRQCLQLDLFKNTVMPILNRFRLVRKFEEDGNDGYQEYTSQKNSFPGINRQGGQNPVFYTCTTCHNEDHPYFKMTTFFDNESVLCSQALSRVDFSNFEKSLLLRGINGTFNHPKLHFVEAVSLTGSGSSKTFEQNPNKVNGFESSWLGLRFDRYTKGSSGAPGVINVDAYTGDDKAYLEKFVGQFQRVKYQRINDPFSRKDGEILLPGDIKNLAFDPQNPDQWTYAATGDNMIEVVNPEDHLGDKSKFDPAVLTSGGLIKVKDSCINVEFSESNGITQDPCNNNVDVTSEFEDYKNQYREAVINWMREEKKAFDAQ